MRKTVRKKAVRIGVQKSLGKGSSEHTHLPLKALEVSILGTEQTEVDHYPR